MSKRSVTGGVLGVLAAGAAVGVAAERYAVGKARLRPDPEAREPFFALPADRVSSVVADDGVPLHVEQVGPLDAPMTLVFCHGYTQEMAAWHYQRLALSEDNPGRLVFWDLRSHGRSGRSTAAHSSIDQLGEDLAAVLTSVVPRGPVVLVGHSLGAMSIMALADRHPELFGPRVVGVGLLSTSSGELAEITFGLPTAITPVTRRVLPWLTRGARRLPGTFERGRGLSTDLMFVLSRRIGFGSPDVSPALVDFVGRMLAQTPVDVIAEFYETFVNHDKLAALDVLRDLEVLVLCGTADRMTPVRHSEAIAAALPDAHLVLVEGAGHMVQLERPALVSLHLRALVGRARQRAAHAA